MSRSANEAVCHVRQSTVGPTTVDIGKNALVNLSNKPSALSIKKDDCEGRPRSFKKPNVKPNPKNQIIHRNVAVDENEAQPSSTNLQKPLLSACCNTAQSMWSTCQNVSAFSIDLDGDTSVAAIEPPVPIPAPMSETLAHITHSHSS